MFAYLIYVTFGEFAFLSYKGFQLLSHSSRGIGPEVQYKSAGGETNEVCVSCRVGEPHPQKGWGKPQEG